MSPEIPAEKMAVYRAAARRRRERQAEAVESRRQRAWTVARQAARLLKEQFGAAQVALFGSALSAETFHARSDVDLAVWGLDERLYYRAVSRLLDLDPAISVDLIEVELASTALQTIIEREGIIL